MTGMLFLNKHTAVLSEYVISLTARDYNAYDKAPDRDHARE
jgi:hypothetical protein